MVSAFPCSSEAVDVEAAIHDDNGKTVGNGETEIRTEEGKPIIATNGGAINGMINGEDRWRPLLLNAGGKDENAAAAAAEEAAEEEADGGVDYVRRGQWLRAAVLGANDGLVSTASLMMGVGANYDKAGAMIVAGLAGLVGGACSMAIGEFVSVYTQRDAEKCHHAAKKKKKKRRKQKRDNKAAAEEMEVEAAAAAAVGPSPWEAAAASAGFFAIGSAVPLLSAGFIAGHLARLLVMLGVCSAALAGLGALAARLSGARPLPGAARVLVGGWLAMLLTFSLLRLFSVVV